MKRRVFINLELISKGEEKEPKAVGVNNIIAIPHGSSYDFWYFDSGEMDLLTIKDIKLIEVKILTEPENQKKKLLLEKEKDN